MVADGCRQVIFSGTRLTAEHKICAPGHQLVRNGLRLAECMTLSVDLHQVIRKRTFLVQRLDTGTIQEFFHP